MVQGAVLRAFLPESTAEISAEQKLLFNEAEVLAAIEAANTSQAAAISAHQHQALILEASGERR